MNEHELLDFVEAIMVRPKGPKTYKPLRQRRQKRTKDQTRLSSLRLAGEVAMEGDLITEAGDSEDNLIDRATLCLPNYAGDLPLHSGDQGFTEALRQYFPASESNATERLVALKAKLRTASTHDFWGLLMEEMCDIMHAQAGFVAKRMLVDDQDSAVEMPELGQPGSCLMGVAFYLNNGADVKEMHHNYRYHAFGTACAHMRHDKVFVIPERLEEFLPNLPNSLPWKKTEAFIGLPLSSEGKCFGHFGMTWSSEGAAKRTLSWSFIEMLLHSLEDMILQRILEGRGFVKDFARPESTAAKIIPLAAITESQSLKPHARSLSHELRTPMQGVIGMLDIMYGTVLDAIANQQNEHVKQVFTNLKKDIEIVQDSSKRAVEAADNVVQAYDLNMQMPEAPLTHVDSGSSSSLPSLAPPHSQNAAGSCLLSPTSRKRARVSDNGFGPLLKRMAMSNNEAEPEFINMDPTASFPDGVHKLIAIPSFIPDLEVDDGESPPKSSPLTTPPILSSSHRLVVTREFMRNVIAESLRGGHPTSEIHMDTDLGEIIEVRTLGSRGEAQDRTIKLIIECDVPEAVVTEEQHVQFSLQKVIDNAIKFTETGSITITVRLSRNTPTVEISVVDTGCGITEQARLSLFRPHFQEDASTSRARDGLGLSLFNAKARVRRNLGGDVTLERSATEGPSKGSEFLIRLPITPAEEGLTPLVGTPTPSGQHSRSGSWCEPAAATGYFLPEPAISRPGTPARQQSPQRLKPSRQAVFNPKLAMEYPLNILIAEDNAINRNVAVAVLSKLGYSKDNITLAYDGIEAVRKYEESLLNPQHPQFDVILMDIWMPNMDGYGATLKILDMAANKGLNSTIIAVTADITNECMQKAKDVGMQGFLSKPFKVIDIQNLILEHFSKE